MVWSRAVSALLVAGLASCAGLEDVSQCHQTPVAADATTLLPGIRFIKDCADCPELAAVPAGQYVMGYTVEGPLNTSYYDYYYYVRLGPAHCSTVHDSFAIGRTEVTVAAWRRCEQAGACRPLLTQKTLRDDDPAYDLDWDMAQDYVHWLSDRSGKRYRLPSEVEWEYAARGGVEHPERLPWADKSGHAACATELERGCRDAEKIFPVRSHLPNPFGLYDMVGNVSEWVADCAHVYGTPVYDIACPRRMMRGFQSGIIPLPGRIWFRDALAHDQYAKMSASKKWIDDYGFRVARDLAPDEQVPPASER